MTGGSIAFDDERFVYSYAGGSLGQYMSGVYYDGSGLNQRYYINNSEQMRLTSTGLGIGTSSPGYKLDVAAGTGFPTAKFSRSGTAGQTGAGYIGFSQIGFSGSTNADMLLRSDYGIGFQINNATSATTAAVIDLSGNLLVGKTSTDTGVAGSALMASASSGFQASFTADDNRVLICNRLTSDGTNIDFRRSGTTVGTISVTTSATAYNTSSDYRLKDNPQPLTGSGAFIDSLKPKTWTWKESGDKGVGFIAHEVQEVSPGSVVGEKDAVDAEGKPKYQAMEYGSAEFIANIIAELQSLRKRLADAGL
jgi:hypothetical protein